MSTDVCESLQEIMAECVRLSWKITYKNMRKDGTYHEPRDDGELSGEEWDLVSGWADGLVHKYYESRATGRCSIQAMIDFDIAKFEESCIEDRAKMREILKRVGEPVVCTDEYLIAGGWKP